MEQETAYQRQGRLQREKQAARAQRVEVAAKQERKQAASTRKAIRQRRAANAAYDNLDWDYSMNG